MVKLRAVGKKIWRRGSPRKLKTEMTPERQISSRQLSRRGELLATVQSTHLKSSPGFRTCKGRSNPHHSHPARNPSHSVFRYQASAFLKVAANFHAAREKPVSTTGYHKRQA